MEKKRPQKIDTSTGFEFDDGIPEEIKTTTTASTAAASTTIRSKSPSYSLSPPIIGSSPASFSPSGIAEQKNNEVIIACKTPPTGQNTNVSYESLGLTPSMQWQLPNYDAAALAIKRDGAWEEEEIENGVVYRLLVFLYGKGYYRDLPKDERVKKIQKLLSNVKDKDGRDEKCHNPRYRLKQLALSESDESRILVSDDDNCRSGYLYMAGTALEVFSHESNLGGFPVRPYIRYQGSKNCYHVTAAMFLTLELQAQNGQQQQPLDVGHIGRRCVIDSVDGLEKRVLQNEGDFANDICSKICGENIFATLDLTSFNDCKPYRKCINKAEFVHEAQQGSFAIVSMKPTQKLRDTNLKTEATNNYGFWKFEEVQGVVAHEDVEGTFVDLNDAVNNNEEISSKLEELKELWERQKIRTRNSAVVESRNHYASRAVSSSFLSESTTTETESSSEDEEKQNSLSEGNTTKANDSSDHHEDTTRSCSARHAMVLLGYIYQGDGKYHPPTPDDYLCVMWNWWPNAPLITMSFDYLVACKAIIYYNKKERIEIIGGDDIKKCEYLATEANSPVYTPVDHPGCLFMEPEEETDQTR